MKVIGCIGAGAFGKVYKVQVKGQVFALKKIPLEFNCNDQDHDIISLKNEVALLYELVYHPNVVRCYQSFRKNDYFCIVMQYVGHQSLDDLAFPLRNQKQIVNLIIQIAMGLKHLKNNKIIHRDIKPNNILISQKGLLKIADFGISKQLKSTIQTQSCLGTPIYAAPQVIDQQKYDYSVDIWSFGVVLYQILHGHLPFIGKDLEELRSKVKYTFPEIRRDIHPDIKLVVRGCLSKDPNNRISVQQILKIPLIQNQMRQELDRQVKYF